MGFEQAFTKLKARLRGVAARTEEARWITVNRSADRFSPDDWRSCLINPGLEFTKTANALQHGVG